MQTKLGVKRGNGKVSDYGVKSLNDVRTPAAAPGANTSPLVKPDIDIKGRVLWLCRMPYGGSRMLAAAFRSIGLDTRVTPSSPCV